MQKRSLSRDAWIWSWRGLGEGSRSWNSSIEDSIRRRMLVNFPLRVSEVLALANHLYIMSYILLLFMIWYLFMKKKIIITKKKKNNIV